MRRSKYIRFAAAVATIALLVAPIATPPARADIMPTAIPYFTFSGSGYGHGIGMSQFGAQGSALAGKSYSWILQHYYTGGVIGSIGAFTAKVNVDSAYTSSYSAYAGRVSWTIRSIDSPLEIYRSGDTTLTLASDTYYVLTVSGSVVSVKTTSGTLVGTFGGSCWAAPKGPAGTYPPLIEVKDASGPFNTGWVRYRGRMLVDVKPGNRVALVNNLDMDQYLYGVVPRESPAGWESEALKAQAVAARSYAYADVAGGNVLKCTTYSQVYNGHSRLESGVVKPHEASTTNAAVDATSRQVVKTGSGAVVKTFFFSTSGGHTANNEDVWVGGTPVPQLRGVEDTYEYLARPALAPWPAIAADWPSGVPAPKLTGASASWWPKISGLELANQIRTLPGVPPAPLYVTGVSIEKAASGHARYVNLTFVNGTKVRVSGDALRGKLKLPSSRFTISGFPMSRIQGPDRYATAIAISQKAFTGTAPAVVLASGEAYPDALCGSALAGAEDGSLLLTAKASLPSAVETELKRLAPARIYIMGSTAAVSADVENRVRAVLPSAVTTRLAGADRYGTSRKVAEKVYALKAPTKAVVANGLAWPDAASVSALAYAKHYPILFSRQSELGTDTAGYLSARKPTGLVVGSETVVPASVFAEVQTLTAKTPQRLAGPNRYATAAAIARFSLGALEGFSSSEVYVTTGLNYPDALAGGVIAGKGMHPLVLTGFDSVPPDTASFLKEKQPTIGYIWILGGAGAISKTGAGAIDSVMMN
ncbi:MAG: cell wall-binding repeat-containing protein [Actinobacteria bacterium]|nr:MAG: cell wall-binding repeat-containing protein [Actinomycetota bacterium]